MNWIIMTFSSSIGKKQVMAVTGLCFCLFLATHLAGNLMIYGGKEMLNAYTTRLHSLGLVINLIELGLLALAVLHVFLATILYVQNFRARTTRYTTNHRRAAPYMFRSLVQAGCWGVSCYNN